MQTTQNFVLRLEQRLNFVLYTLMTSGSAPSLGWSFYQALRRGYIPIRWMGTWPDGYCVAYCPAGLPHATVPPDCVPTKEQLAAGKAKKPTTKKPAATKPREPVPVTDSSTWTSLSSSSDVSSAFRQHFAALAVTDACKAVLDTVSRQVVGIRVDDSALVIEFTSRTITCDNGRRITTPRRLRCTAPYAGKASTLPHSVEAVLRLHNGMRGEEALAPLEWHRFDGNRFVMDWSLWWTADPEDPDEIFAEPPQVPLTDGDELWLLHPSSTNTAGEPALVRMSHETADLSKSLPFGAGGAFLRLLACALDLDASGVLLQELRGDG